MIVLVAIGNSDDKLTQEEWSKFWMETNAYITDMADEMYGVWMSDPTSKYQNACWQFRIEDNMAYRVQQSLKFHGRTYRQDSTAWTECLETVFLS